MRLLTASATAPVWNVVWIGKDPWVQVGSIATVTDEGLGGAQDAEAAAVCIAEERVLVTQDLDFADIRTYPPAEYSGIVVFRLPTAARDAILEVGAIVIGRLDEPSPRGQLWIVEDSRIRIRG